MTGNMFRLWNKDITLISKEKIMGIIQLALFTLNLVIGMMNYELGNYGVAMFNTAVASLCLGFLIDLILKKL